MKFKAIILISLFSLGLFANGALQGPDSIMSESLKRQGMPLNSPRSYMASNEQSDRPQAQQETKPPVTKESVQKMEETIQVLERKVDRLEKKLARAAQSREKKQEQTERGNKSEGEKMKKKNLEGLVFSEELSSPVDRGNIGKFSVQQGKAESIANYENAPVETRTLPALKVCAVMADANRMSVEDFAFLGMSRDAAMNAVAERMKRGQYTSSKQLAEVEGVGPDGYSKIEDKIIAIKSERFSE